MHLLQELLGVTSPSAALAVTWLLHRAASRHREARANLVVPQPGRVVRWDHVADLERDIFGRTFHHADAPCRCDECNAKAAPVRRFPHQPQILDLEPKVIRRFKIDTPEHVVLAERQRARKAVLDYADETWQDARIRLALRIAADRITAKGDDKLTEALHRARMRGVGGQAEATLRTSRREAWEAARAMIEAAERSGRPMTDAEQRTWDNLLAFLDALDHRLCLLIARREALEKVVKLAQTDRANAIYRKARHGQPGFGYGLSYVEVHALGDAEPRYIPADPQTQQAIDYDRGRELGRDIIRRLEKDTPDE